MQAGGRKKVAKVVHFEIVDVSHAGDTAVAALPDDLLGGEVTVRLLGPADEADVFVQLVQQIAVVGANGGVDRSFHPFVKVAVAEHRAVEAALRFAGADAEIFQHMADVFAFEHVLQLGYGSFCAGVRPFFPQSPGPGNVAKVERGDFCVRRMSCICQHFCPLSTSLAYSRPFACSACFKAAAPNRGLERTGFPHCPARYSST
jgi:hypothetical protein